ncbi:MULTISPECIES: hypothetical protein [Sphingobacterium]|uniref:hypothetical protein n=1 Tax=Sphingobacterium TaxID=28453 RepID=UPI00257EA68F|nr:MULTISPECIES: hypothetical protein [Sphingobacterium]
MSLNNKTKSESKLSAINQEVFFKEFTFSKNDFKIEDKSELELADNLVWLDDKCFIYQTKEMNQSSVNYENWFKSKVLKKAVKQIKDTLNYLDVHQSITIENEKGHILNVSDARKCENIKKIIIYEPNDDFPERLRHCKFYESSEVGHIHLFHMEDYFHICKYLITPSEVYEYLDFREDFFEFYKDGANRVHEQYLLGHFFETPNVDHFNAEYIKNLKDQHIKKLDFDISGLIENFKKAIINSGFKPETHYYPIIKAIAQLKRSELTEFKKRISTAIERCEKFEFIIPYKFYSMRTDCAFVFIPLHSKNINNAVVALRNLTYAIKYDNKSSKALGVVVYRNPENIEKIETAWMFIEEDFVFDENMEKALKDNYPFRKSIHKEIKNPYK